MIVYGLSPIYWGSNYYFNFFSKTYQGKIKKTAEEQRKRREERNKGLRRSTSGDLERLNSKASEHEIVKPEIIISKTGEHNVSDLVENLENFEHSEMDMSMEIVGDSDDSSNLNEDNNSDIGGTKSHY